MCNERKFELKDSHILLLKSKLIGTDKIYMYKWPQRWSIHICLQVARCLVIVLKILDLLGVCNGVFFGSDAHILNLQGYDLLEENESNAGAEGIN